MAMRSLGSISSELCEMQALRESNLALGAKDLEWQRRIAGPRSVPGVMDAISVPVQPGREFFSHPNINPTGENMIPVARREGSPASSTPSSSRGSDSTRGASPDLDSGERRRGDGCRGGRVGKIRRHRMTKEEEARFDPVDLSDLKGSTAAKSRKMTEEERDIMLHKRRLRNRQSAARSRDKQRKTIGDVGEEVDDLLKMTLELKHRCERAEREMDELRKTNDGLKKENAELRKGGMKKSPSCLRVSMSSDMLDKIIGGEAVNTSSAMLKIPSKLHLSVNTDALASGDLWGSQLPPMPRNASVLERLLDIANNIDSVHGDPVMYDSMTANSSSNATASF